jgi:DNA repair protein RecO (recombination protein O)
MKKNQGVVIENALIIKKKNIFESDQLVTFICHDLGKITCLAKGSRKLKSKKLAVLQSGNLAKLYLIRGKNFFLLTQASLVSSLDNKLNLNSRKNVLQFLEILDKIIVEEEMDKFIYDEICIIRNSIINNKQLDLIRAKIKNLLLLLGFDIEKEGEFKFLTEYIAYLTNRKLKSFAFLTI